MVSFEKLRNCTAKSLAELQSNFEFQNRFNFPWSFSWLLFMTPLWISKLDQSLSDSLIKTNWLRHLIWWYHDEIFNSVKRMVYTVISSIGKENFDKRKCSFWRPQWTLENRYIVLYWIDFAYTCKISLSLTEVTILLVFEWRSDFEIILATMDQDSSRIDS